jgi:regulator of sigma E protease
MFLAMEAIRRRPPSVRVREVANVVGLVMLLMLMVLVFKNDIVRFVLG